MFSMILHSSVAFFLSHNTRSESAISLKVHQQIQTELEQAAEQGMLSTRNQDSTSAGGAQPSKLLYPLVVIPEKKRKVANDGEDSPAQVVSKKRRRSVKSNGDSTPSSNASKPGRPRKVPAAKTTNDNASHIIDHRVSDPEPSMQNSRPTSPQTPGLTSEQTLRDGQMDKAVEVAVKEPSDIPDIDTGLLESHDQVKLDADGPTKPRKGRIPKKRMKDSNGTGTLDENGTDVAANGEIPKPALATPAKATHKRFGSEDTEVLAAGSPAGIEQRQEGQEDSSEDGSESEDEAPETVSASAGFDKARTSTLEAAKIATKQKAEKKLKRREHDERLRLQAKSAKDPGSNDKSSTKAQRKTGSSTKVTEANDQLPDLGSEVLGDRRKTPLPLLLPEEILAAQPIVHTSTPPSSNNKVAISQKRRLLDLEPKPPKDIKRGNVTITVLQDNRSILPPKSSQRSKALRESWLTGRPGLKGKVCVPRQKPTGSFIRKKV